MKCTNKPCENEADFSLPNGERVCNDCYFKLERSAKYYKEINYPSWKIMINGVPFAYNKKYYSFYSSLVDCFSEESLKIISEEV